MYHGRLEALKPPTYTIRRSLRSSNRHRRWTEESLEMESHVASRERRPWTNEKHVQFLNSMEASFVCAMFEKKGRLVRLDRFMPDTSDSTLDLKPHRPTKKHNNTPAAEGRMDGRVNKRVRRLSSQPLIKASQDQVVPEFEVGTVGDKDES